jgi:hypothetical protein
VYDKSHVGGGMDRNRRESEDWLHCKLNRSREARTAFQNVVWLTQKPSELKNQDALAMMEIESSS